MGKRIPDADATAYPWFGIVNPRQMMRGSDVHPTAGTIRWTPW